MFSVLGLSDTTINPIIKEVKEISNNEIIITPDFSEDLALKIMSLTSGGVEKYDLIFIHSDQVFSNKNQQWQNALLDALIEMKGRINKKILLSNAISQSFASVPINSSFGYTWDLAEIYGDKIKKLLQSSNVIVFDFYSLCMKVGTANFYNYNLGHLYQMPYTKQGIKAISQRLVEQVKWMFAEEKKAIIVDCDNTLWKGIVGEDGIDGIVCDNNAEGILFYNFQQFLKAKKEEGFLLCICSKNNEHDVKAAFDKKNFPLKWNDFTVKKINWEDKIINIKNIAKDLNIGTDSFIFIDDNLFELNSVKELVKGVTCMHLTREYNDLVNIMDSLLFRRKQILQADKEKSAQYEKEQLRNEEAGKFSNMKDFIASLEIKMDIRQNDINDLERLSQMTGKTNQFNFNKQAYSVDELKEYMEKKNRIYSLKVSDKYGDYGTVGLILITLNGKDAIMENYLMSCRALGKGIEDKFYHEVIEDLKNNKIFLKETKFVKNDKNIPAQEFLKSRKV